MAIPVKKEQLRDISCRDFFRQHVGPLKQKGRRFWGNCIFHKEKTDSLVVDERRFHCFGCGADGDVFELARHFWDCGFSEAVERLAAEYGITADRDIPARVRLTSRTDAETFHETFCKLFQVRQAFYGFLKNYHDEPPAQLVFDLGTVDGLMEEMIKDDPDRRNWALDCARGMLLKWQML